MAGSAWFRGEGGGLHKFDLPLSEVYAAQEAAGRLTRVDPPAPAPAAPVAAEPVEAVEPVAVPERPAQADRKADWVAYAAAVSDLTEAEADEMTKADLIDRFGGDD